MWLQRRIGRDACFDFRRAAARRALGEPRSVMLFPPVCKPRVAVESRFDLNDSFVQSETALYAIMALSEIIDFIERDPTSFLGNSGARFSSLTGFIIGYVYGERYAFHELSREVFPR